MGCDQEGGRAETSRCQESLAEEGCRKEAKGGGSGAVRYGRRLIHRACYRDYQFPEAELRAAEALVGLRDYRLVLGLLGASVGIAEQLFHNALLANWFPRQPAD